MPTAASPSRPAPPGRPALSRRRLRFPRRLGRVIVAGLLLLLALLAWLSVAGFPDIVTERIIKPWREAGLRLDFERPRLDIRQGITADRIRIYGGEDDPEPFLEAARVVFRFNPIHWLRGRSGFQGIHVVDGRAQLKTAVAPGDTRPPETLSLEDLNGSLVLEKEGLRIPHVSASALGVRLDVSGFVVLTRPAGRPPSRRGLVINTQPVAEVLHRAPEWFPHLVQELEAIRFDTPPRISVRFLMDPEQWDRTEVRLALEGGRSRGRGISFDRMQGEAEWKDRRVQITSLTAEHAGRRLELSGAYDLGTRMVEARFFSSLPPPLLTSLIPVAWRDQLNDAQVKFLGPVECELLLGPAPAEQVARRIRGSLSVQHTEIRGVWLDRGRASFGLTDDDLVVSGVDAVLGRGPMAGPVKGEFQCNLANRHYEGAGWMNFNPNILMPNLNMKQQEIVRRMSFPDKPPRAELRFGGQLGSPRDFHWTGRVSATNLYYNGAYLSYMQSPVAVSNEVMVADPFLIVREEGRASGRLEMDFHQNLARIVATNTADPKVIARMLGPKSEMVLRTYRVEGPATVVVDGLVDYEGNQQTDLKASVHAEKLGIRWFLADQCSFDLYARGPEVLVTNLAGVLYGGSFAGYVRVDGVGSETNITYQCQVACTNVDFAEVVMQLRQHDRDPYTGKFAAFVEVAGGVGEGKGKTATGAGHLSIQGGRLMQIPLLGGLSAMLSRIYPGLGFAHQTDLNATFVIRNLQVRTDDVKLEGGLLSLHAKGKYFFNEDLDFDVKVKPLREGVVAELVQFITSPLTKLLEFHLDGTVREPKWRPENLPKELFLIRD
jgi:hypothetical protein